MIVVAKCPRCGAKEDVDLDKVASIVCRQCGVTLRLDKYPRHRHNYAVAVAFLRQLVHDRRFIWVACTLTVCVTVALVGSMIVSEYRDAEFQRQLEHEDRLRVLEDIRDAVEYPPPRRW